MKENSLKKKLKKIKALVLDVDGILTDGKIIYDGDGKEIKIFDVQDGYGIVLFHRAGYKTAIISARCAVAVTVRAQDLGIDRIYQDAKPKLKAYEELLRDLSLKDEEMCFMGDDLPDLQVLQRVGLAVSVPNGSPDVKRKAHHITKRSGGQGAVREMVELILKSQGKWQEILDSVTLTATHKEKS